ncbi:TetR/AcrR family transcriptional regulator [Echinicola strongylocentroti]|uniref:TetR/AcrR family transcriptional regulator n=1 Tax=Echinicola strongylocentroti TaxID=1795355 RepID=A0A2Z4IEM3_9BACT|nr:helix-turn-helix domain-containing protein [Echinicola strongylocentroti]AWW29220.1 TetR/AcrR family transcriptional regulator [Echinicola strongylocentroti]
MPRVKLFDEKEVLEKAMNLFWKNGYYATSIQDLVAFLGINRASLYATFGGKKELFEKAFAHYTTTTANAQKEFLNAQTDIRVGFKKLFENAIQQSTLDTDKKGCFTVNCTIEFIPNESELADLVCQNKLQCEKMLLHYLKLGVERNQISKDKDLQAIATLLFTFYSGLKVITKVDFDPAEFSRSVDALLKVLD